jgi:hypothetical protein
MQMSCAQEVDAADWLELLSISLVASSLGATIYLFSRTIRDKLNRVTPSIMQM